MVGANKYESHPFKVMCWELSWDCGVAKNGAEVVKVMKMISIDF